MNTNKYNVNEFRIIFFSD